MVYTSAGAWLVSRDGSVLAAAFLLAEGVTPSTTIAWSIVSGAVVGALVAGIAWGRSLSRLNTLTKVVGDQQVAQLSDRAAREKDAETWAENSRDTHGRLIALETQASIAGDVKALATEIKTLVSAVDRQSRHFASLRSRERSGPH